MHEMNADNERKSVSYNVYLKNGERVLNLTLEELLELPNAKQSTITSINVANEMFQKVSLIILFNNSEVVPIEYQLRTESKKDLLYYQERIEVYTESLKTMYSPLSISIWHTIFFLTIPTLIILIGLIANFTSFFQIHPTFEAVVKFVLAGLIGFLIGTYKAKIFPAGEFKIGHGIEMANRREWIRNSVLVVLALGVLTNLIGIF